MAVKGGIKNYKQIKKELDRMRNAPKKAFASMDADLRDRAPKWIAAGVVDRYAIEGGKNKGKAAILQGKVGSLKINGSIKNNTIQLQYSGRLLTPSHFGMTPTGKPAPWTPYTLKWRVRQGSKGANIKIKKLTKKQLKNIGRNFTRQGTQNSPRSPWMLQPTGAMDIDKVQAIPFQRRGQTNPFDKVARTVSLPQMITKGKNGELHPEVAKHFDENIEKRVTHYINRYLGNK